MVIYMQKKVFMTPGSSWSEGSNFCQARIWDNFSWFPIDEFGRKNRPADDDNFFLHVLLPQLIQFYTDFWSVYPDFVSRWHIAPRWVQGNQVRDCSVQSVRRRIVAILWCLWSIYLREEMFLVIKRTISGPTIPSWNFGALRDNLEPAFEKPCFQVVLKLSKTFPVPPCDTSLTSQAFLVDFQRFWRASSDENSVKRSQTISPFKNFEKKPNLRKTLFESGLEIVSKPTETLPVALLLLPGGFVLLSSFS